MATAEKMFSKLRGIFCIYKPPGQSMKDVVTAIQLKLTNELNALPCRPPRQIIQFNEEPQDGSSNTLPTITTVPDLADSTLVLGPRYEKEDLSVTFVDALPRDCSGVTPMCIGTTSWLRNVSVAKQMRVYHLKGELGRASDNFSGTGKTAERTTYGHVTPAKMDRVITAMQAGHQKNMLIASRLDLQSQDAYELAVQGLVRPTSSEGGPVIYGFKCTDFNPPNFSIEVHSVNETGPYLQKLIHQLGLELKSSAVCTQLRRVRYGRLLLDHALLQKHWTAEHIIDNMQTCGELFKGDRVKHKPLIGHREEQELLDVLNAGT